MITNMLWLFSAYRELHAENTRLKQTINDLEQQLKAAPATLPALLEQFQQIALTEEEFPDGKIPDHLWLTPVDER